jgi:uncharacterized protein
MTAEDTKQRLARAFHQALLTRDWESLRSIMAPDVTWTLPGDNRISGTATGIDHVIERAILIASYGPSFELLNILVSRDNMALAIHNQASRGDLVLDEYLATVCTISDGMIDKIETYLSGVDGMNAFFAVPPTGNHIGAADRRETRRHERQGCPCQYRYQHGQAGDRIGGIRTTFGALMVVVNAGLMVA